MSAALETRGLTRRFGAFVAVDAVSLRVEPGARHALIGPNGAGKTTFVNLLSGALAASAGRLVDGGVADVCIFDLADHWRVTPQALRSQGKHTPFAGHEVPGRVKFTVVSGQVAFEAS